MLEKKKPIFYIPSQYLDSNGFEKLWMSQWEFHHLFDLGQLFSATTNIIIPHFVQLLFFFLKNKKSRENKSF